MIDEQAGQSTPAPRQWTQGDASEPPADVTLVRYERELPHPFLRRSDVNDLSGEGMWVLESSADPDTWSPGAGWPWSRRIEQTKMWGPLTEVVPPSSVSPSGENTTPVGEDTGEDSSDAQRLAELIAATDRQMSPEDFAEPRRAARALAEAVLAEGWRPPLPDSDAEPLADVARAEATARSALHTLKLAAAERDLLLWLHAEAAWRVAGFDVLTVELARRNHQLAAERDERQARIDAVLALMDYWDAHGGSIPQGHRLRALLRGDQPPRKPCEYVVSAWAGQEGAECIAMAEPGSDYCKPHGDALKALSGVALRDVEERDDAAGDLP